MSQRILLWPCFANTQVLYIDCSPAFVNGGQVKESLMPDALHPNEQGAVTSPQMVGCKFMMIGVRACVAPCIVSTISTNAAVHGRYGGMGQVVRMGNSHVGFQSWHGGRIGLMECVRPCHVRELPRTQHSGTCIAAQRG